MTMRTGSMEHIRSNLGGRQLSGSWYNPIAFQNPGGRWKFGSLFGLISNT